MQRTDLETDPTWDDPETGADPPRRRRWLIGLVASLVILGALLGLTAAVEAAHHTACAAQKLNGLLAAFNELADAYASERDTDAESIKAAVREALQEGVVTVDINVTDRAPDNEVAAQRAQLEQQVRGG